MALERVPIDSIHWVRSHGDHVARYLFAIKFVQGMRVLDAGTGPGYGAMLLADSGASEVIAVDIDHDTIRDAQQKFGASKIVFQIDNCETLLSVKEQVDVICSFENIEHLQEPHRFLARACELLKPDGVLLCSSPDLDGPYEKHENGRTKNDYHVNEWQRNEFHELLSKYFHEVELLTQIESLSCRHRQIAVQNLSNHLKYLWSVPTARLGRTIGRLFGVKKEWPSVAELGFGSPADYPVVPSTMGKILGVPYCHFAICRSPILAGK